MFEKTKTSYIVEKTIYKMDEPIFKETSADQKDWINFFKDLPVKKLKIIKKVGDKVWINCPTGFILSGEKHYILGYTTQSNVFYDTEVFNPHVIMPYSTTKIFVSKRDFHSALFYRIDLLDKLNINISDIKWFEISRRCLFVVFTQLDMSLLYRRELKLLQKIKAYNEPLYKTLATDNEKLYHLYHDFKPRKTDFNYAEKVQALTYKWITET